MSTNWIKMRTDLQTSPKVIRISSALRADRLRTIGGLHSAWCLFDAHSIDGELEGYTLEALDELIGWPGFSAALQSVGWLVVTPESLILPRFSEHNGKSAKRRAAENDRKRSGRLSASDADEMRPRVDKSREDINTKGVPPSGDEKPKAKRQKKPLAIFDASSIPAALQTGGFPAAWERWLIYRRDLGKPVLASSVDAVFEKSMSIGAATAAAKFQHAIAQGWQGWDFGDTAQAATTAKPPEQPAKPDEFALMAEAYRATRKQREVPQ